MHAFHNNCIAFFDSGVGGLTILRHVYARCPQYSYVYACDDLYQPYGSKDDVFLTERVCFLTRFIIERYNPVCFVVACNTVSTVLLDVLRREHPDTEIVGVVPAIKPAAQLGFSGAIALLATPATLSRSYTQRLIDQYASCCEIIRVPSTELVRLAERKLRGHKVDKEILAHELQPIIQNKQIRVVVLGCTHFPLLVEEMASLCSEKLTWLDSGEAIARRVESLLTQQNDLAITDQSSEKFLWLSSLNKEFDLNISVLQRVGLGFFKPLSGSLPKASKLY